MDKETESQARDVFVPRHMAGMWDLNPCLLTPTHVGSMADDSGGIEEEARRAWEVCFGD